MKRLLKKAPFSLLDSVRSRMRGDYRSQPDSRLSPFLAHKQSMRQAIEDSTCDISDTGIAMSPRDAAHVDQTT
jgi:hypothetical protein